MNLNNSDELIAERGGAARQANDGRTVQIGFDATRLLHYEPIHRR